MFIIPKKLIAQFKKAPTIEKSHMLLPITKGLRAINLKEHERHKTLLVIDLQKLLKHTSRSIMTVLRSLFNSKLKFALYDFSEKAIPYQPILSFLAKSTNVNETKITKKLTTSLYSWTLANLPDRLKLNSLNLKYYEREKN